MNYLKLSIVPLLLTSLVANAHGQVGRGRPLLEELKQLVYTFDELAVAGTQGTDGYVPLRRAYVEVEEQWNLIAQEIDQSDPGVAAAIDGRLRYVSYITHLLGSCFLNDCSGTRSFVTPEELAVYFTEVPQDVRDELKAHLQQSFSGIALDPLRGVDTADPAAIGEVASKALKDLMMAAAKL